MDYEKKYKEAIERAKIWQEHLYDVNDKDYADELNYIFPELAESEDERMKKAIIATIHLYYGEPLEDEAKEMIAWLEKQGKKKSNSVLDIEIPFGAKDSELQEASYHIPEGFHAEIDGNRVVIKRGEQKPADEIKPIVVRDFNSVFSREQVEEIDKRIEESQRLYNAKLRDAMRKVEDFPMTD